MFNVVKRFSSQLARATRRRRRGPRPDCSEFTQVRTTEGWAPRMVAMWGKETELGMAEYIEIVPVPGYNYSVIYKFERCVRTGQ
jgi:hypothetical protein